MEHRAGAPGHPNIARLENLERHDRGVHQIPQFMSEEPEALARACRLFIDAGLISFTSVLSHRAGDAILKASVQRSKIIRIDRRVQFHPLAR